jgi:RHS repeat-associated protein
MLRQLVRIVRARKSAAFRSSDVQKRQLKQGIKGFWIPCRKALRGDTAKRLLASVVAAALVLLVLPANAQALDPKDGAPIGPSRQSPPPKETTKKQADTTTSKTSTTTSSVAAAQAATATEAYATGDVFAGLRNGTIAHFDKDGSAKGSLSTGTSSYETGMCFDGAGNLYSTNFGFSNMTKFDNVGSVVTFPWGGTFGGHPESCVINNKQHVFVGSVDSAALREFDTNGTLLKTFSPATEDRGVDWIDLSGDQCTMLYTSEAGSVKAFDVCSNTQLNDFATNLPEPCFALRILKDGRVAVACYREVVLLDKSGAVSKRYTAASIGDSGALFAFNVTPDNAAFWTANLSTGDIWKVRFSDGSVLAHVSGGQGVFGLAVFGEGGPVGEPLRPSEAYGGGGLSQNTTHGNCRQPVDCENGNFWHTFSDLTIPGRGRPLDLSRTYNALAADTDSPFGFGWSSSYTAHLDLDKAPDDVTVVQENGSTATFHADGNGGYSAPPRVFATLTKNQDGTYSFVRHHRETFVFSATGALLSETDRNGYTTTLAYDTDGHLVTVTDPAKRQLSFSYTNGKISGVSDPAGRHVSYTYNSAGDLTGVTDVGGGNWELAYDGSHHLTSMTNPRGGVLKNEYDSQDRVVSQTDPQGRATTFAYDTTTDGTKTTITHPKGNVTVENYAAGELTKLTKGAGTNSAATWTYAYDQFTLGVTAITDPNGHITRRAYDPNGNLVSVTDALGRTAAATYNALEEPLTTTDPSGATTTYTYDDAGNVQTVSRPLTGTNGVQKTTVSYGDADHPGDGTELTDPEGHAWRFAYDSNGDLASATDPVGNKSSYDYDSIGRRTSAISGRGNADGASAADFTTTYDYDAFGGLTKYTDPLGHVTKFAFDENRNRTSLTDPNGNSTTHSYNADDEITKTTRADGTVLSYAYDSNGNQIKQTDGAGHATEYAYDALDRLAALTDPLGRATKFDYDSAGNRTGLTDPSGQTTSYDYDAANELTSIKYSDGQTAGISYKYDDNGRRTAMDDGTGKTTYSYDSLNRLTSSTNGAGATVTYGYDLVGRLTALTYPNGKTVNRDYDAAGRLTAVADWLGNTTKLAHDPNGNLTAETYPNGVKADQSFDNSDQLTAITNRHDSDTLASFTYTRDDLGQLTSVDPKGVPGAAESYGYSKLNQLATLNTKPYEYDPADNLTKLPDGTKQTFDAANQLTSSAPPASGPTSPTVDQVVSSDQKTAATTISSPTVKTTSGNELVLAFISIDGATGQTQKVTKVSGGGLTWSLASRANNDRGTAEVWQAYAKDKVSGAVSATLNNGRYDGSITVASFTDAAPTVGATTSNTATKASAPSVSLKTTKAGSLVWAAGFDRDHAATITPLDKQTIVHQFQDARVDRSYWAQRTTDPIAKSGTTVSIGASKPTADRWQMAAVEIVLASDTTTTGSPTTYAYDREGNRTKITPATGSETTLQYDQANRLTGYGTKAKYSYDGDGLRMSKNVDGTATAFSWDQSGSLPLLLADGDDYYIYGADSHPIEKISGSSVSYLHQDQQGSTRFLTDSSGTVTGTYSYDPYGKVTDHTGKADTTLQYNGQYTDKESGYQYLRARYYDLQTGQFLTRDPVSALSRQPYGYASDNPINWTDPFGLWPSWGTILGGVSTVTGAVALGLALTGVLAPVAAVFEGVSVVTGIGAAVLDCSEAVNLQCGLDVAAASLGAAGFTVRGAAWLGKTSAQTGELIDEVLGIHAVHISFVATLLGLFRESSEDESSVDTSC